MKRILTILFFTFYILLFTSPASAQCSICTKTAAQMGEKPARGLNSGIIYLAVAPMAIVGLIGYRWWKRNGTS